MSIAALLALALTVSAAPPPRLVVVIAVDQLRADYLDRFRPWFGAGGFNRLLRDGASYPRARYEHVTTETCPGHAVMLTGSYAGVNGIVANSWYDPVEQRAVYCAEDGSTKLVGGRGSGRSPRQLLTMTVGDELELATGGRSRIVTVSRKDRAAIMLGGHRADAAYWIVDTLFVTSSWYLPDLPDWVKAVNRSHPITRYFGTTWDRLLPAAVYDRLGPDDVPAESEVEQGGRTFPHRIVDLDGFEHSPMLDDAVAEFAMRAVREEGMGRDSVPDLLAVSFSATDLIGHLYGPDSHEILDQMVRLDRTLARLFTFLDRQVGPGRTLIVLTADHGVAPLPEQARGIRPDGPQRLDPAMIDSAVNLALTDRYGPAPAPGWVSYDQAPLLYLSRQALSARRVGLSDAERLAEAALMSIRGMHDAVTGVELTRLRADGVETDVTRAYYPARGADLYYFLDPYWLVTDQATGTTHGSRWRYDQEVPLLWLGPGIRAGVRNDPATVADLAPTLARLLGVSTPGGAQGRVLGEILR
ncbi:MAG TPA: alkaline phosphatase family protein [Gemmatimonadales bacterium]|nr:alkaline phosphatase family protein [Gemmatimonadales bacterium]